MFRRLQWVARTMQNAGPARGPRLAWTAEDGATRQFFLPDNRPIVAGRDSTVDIRGDNARFSRRHFEVTPEADGFVLRDLESSNGTRVNGRRTQQRQLRDGDVIEAGRQLFVFLLR